MTLQYHLRNSIRKETTIKNLLKGYIECFFNFFVRSLSFILRLKVFSKNQYPLSGNKTFTCFYFIVSYVYKQNQHVSFSCSKRISYSLFKTGNITRISKLFFYLTEEILDI